jgi:outer membrane protein assembly factor BamA
VIEPFVEYATVDPTINDYSGGRYRLSVAEYQDRTGGPYSFRRWDADLRHYLTFVKDTRTIAVRAWVTSATADAGHEVPFYLQPTLGGGRTLRGFHTFRFRDTTAMLFQGEYRWRINQFVQGALFYDTGAVGSALDSLGGFERSYGVGLRAGGRTGSAFRVEMALGGSEGNRLLVRFDDAF